MKTQILCTLGVNGVLEICSVLEIHGKFFSWKLNTEMSICFQTDSRLDLIDMPS